MKIQLEYSIVTFEILLNATVLRRIHHSYIDQDFTMADERSDLCECIWSHEFAMQRLLSILRQSQSYCTDNECFSISQLPGPRDDPLPSNFFMTILLVIAFAILMYAFRPNSLRSNSRQSSNDTVKDRDNERDSNNDPPAPPPTA